MNVHAMDLYIRDKVKYRDAINELFLFSAHLGDRGAQYNLGRKLVEGDDIERNKQIGRCWLEKSASQNNVQALFYLGSLDIEKNGQKWVSSANEYFRKASELNYAPAICSLGLSYLKGLGVEKNIKKAIRHFESAVIAGSKKCATNLILLYSNGKELPPNYCLAKKWTKYPYEITNIGVNNIEFINKKSLDCD